MRALADPRRREAWLRISAAWRTFEQELLPLCRKKLNEPQDAREEEKVELPINVEEISWMVEGTDLKAYAEINVPTVGGYSWSVWQETVEVGTVGILAGKVDTVEAAIMAANEAAWEVEDDD